MTLNLLWQALLVSQIATQSFAFTTPMQQPVRIHTGSPPRSLPPLNAKKRNTNKKSKVTGDGGGKGFGKARPSLEEVVSGFRTRLPSDPDSLDCPCQSGQTYGNCCAPMHRGQTFPESPLEVLRSRYSAFYFRLPLYIMDTTHPDCRDYTKDRIGWAKMLDEVGMFDSYQFVKLEPGEVSETGSEASMSFKVTMRDQKSTEDDDQSREFIAQEVSRFVKDGEPKRWRYAGGDVRTLVGGIDDVVLNQ